MSRADEIFISNCKDILENGVWDTDLKVRPRWDDGESAHTVKKFGIVNRYDLSEEFPALTLRPTAIKSATDEILWIWQRKSNNIHDLKPHIWDEWANEDGSIGKAYGYQMAKKYQFAQGEMDQVDNVLWQLKNTPASRRIMTNIYNFADLTEMGLEPCAYSMTFNVTGNRLNGILNQRSQDTLTANNWNVVQYSASIFTRFGRGFLFGKDSSVFRPITSTFPVVFSRKYFISAEMRCKRSPSLPIPQSASTATIISMFFLLIGNQIATGTRPMDLPYS